MISLNRYNKQTSSAKGVQEVMCEKEEDRLGIVCWHHNHMTDPPSFIKFTPCKISDFLVIAIISSQTCDVTTQNIESAITAE